jgi:hypothetical protein
MNAAPVQKRLKTGVVTFEMLSKLRARRVFRNLGPAQASPQPSALLAPGFWLLNPTALLHRDFAHVDIHLTICAFAYVLDLERTIV